jgi:hypothetical protein
VRLPLATRFRRMLDYLNTPSKTFFDPHALPVPVYT